MVNLASKCKLLCIKL
ncbi:hypothetical protein B4U79_13142 [Dinothrombium tinctorium]|uniref:Uncharacterized protein n=1 Tax=Dinothrombium tinctorium TaxID=1965070 RepID=A0A443Q5Z3_9ACAR|nr:hypothetical protein B4U79_13142 [Dinothrombium tinctorium]